MEFAVTHNGKTQWVLAVDPVGERLLMAPDGVKLKWVDMKDCKFAMLAGPEQARPVVVMQPLKQGPQLARVRPTIVRGNNG